LLYLTDLVRSGANMADDNNAPATKKDIALLMGEFGKMWQWRADVDGWRKEVDNQFVELREDMTKWKKELKDHFDLVAENIRHDFRAANREEIEVLKDGHKGHEKRILTLERAAGLSAR